jgi:hypothetical protein
MANLAWIMLAWITVGALLAAAGHTYRRLRYGKPTVRHLANHPGRNPHLLRECRRIHAQPLATRKEKP